MREDERQRGAAGHGRAPAEDREDVPAPRAPGKQTLTQRQAIGVGPTQGGAATEVEKTARDMDGSSSAGDWVMDEGLMSAMGLSGNAVQHVGVGASAAPSTPPTVRRPGQPVLVLHKSNEPAPSPQHIVRLSISAAPMTIPEVIRAVVQAYGIPAERAAEFDEYMVDVEPKDSPGVTAAEVATAAGVLTVGVSPALDELLRKTAAQMSGASAKATGAAGGAGHSASSARTRAAGAAGPAGAAGVAGAGAAGAAGGAAAGKLEVPERLKDFFLDPLSSSAGANRAVVQQAIAELSSFSDQDLTTFRLLGTHIARDPEKLLRSARLYRQLKAQYQSALDQALQEAAADRGDLVIDDDTSRAEANPATFKRWSRDDKERIARDQMTKLRNQQLGELAKHPGRTLKEMAHAIVRPDLALTEASNALHDAGNTRGGWEGAAKSADAASKMSGVLTVVLGLLALVAVASGVGVPALGEATLAMMFTSLSLSMVEKDLYIKAAGAADSPEKHQAMIEAGAAAEVRAIIGLAGLGAAVAGSLLGRIPLPGRLQSIDNALRLARASVARNVGEAWRGVASDAALKLRAAARGLRGQLGHATNTLKAASGKLATQTADAFFAQLERDPELRTALGVPQESAAALAKLAKDPAAQADIARLFHELKAAALEGPALAEQQLDAILACVERHAQAIEAASTAEQLETAAAQAQAELGDEAMVQMAAQGEAHTAGKIKELAGEGKEAAGGAGAGKAAGGGDAAGDADRAVAEPAAAPRDGTHEGSSGPGATRGGGGRDASAEGAGTHEGAGEHRLRAEPPHAGGRFGSNPDNVEEFLTDPNPVPEVAEARAGMKNLDSPSTMLDARRVLQGLRAKLLANKAQEVANVEAALAKAGVAATSDEVAMVFDYVFDSQGIQFEYSNYSAWRKLSSGAGRVDDVRFLVHELTEVGAMKRAGFTDPTGRDVDGVPGSATVERWRTDFTPRYVAAHGEALRAEAEYLSNEVRRRTRGQLNLTAEEVAASDPDRSPEFRTYMRVDYTTLGNHPGLGRWNREHQQARIPDTVASSLGLPTNATIGHIIQAIKQAALKGASQ
jgi:hypothetical protein